MAKPKVIVVVGPTASGKTSLAINIAKQFHGEVISADSRQVYRGLDIGTAKISQPEMQGIRHHLIDIVDVDTVYTATDFKRDASALIEEVTVRGHLPIIAGGTFFYIDTLLGRIAPPAVSPNPTLRTALEKLTTTELHQQLEKKDPRRAAEIDPQNRRRLIRALEIVDTLGAVPAPQPNRRPYDVLTLGIATDSTELRKRLRARAETWLEIGFIEEVQLLLEAGVKRERLAEIGFEYLIGLDYLDGKLTKEKFVEVFEQKNWQYAKRQMTWLKRDQTIHWVSPADKAEVDFLIKGFLL